MNKTWVNQLPNFIRARLNNRQNLQKIIGNIGWLFADKILRIGVGVFVSIWVARYLGPEQFGLYNYALAFVAMFSALANLGLDGIVVRNIIRDPSASDELLGTACSLKLIGGISTLLITGIAIYLIRPEDNICNWLVRIIAVGTIFQAFDVIDLWFQAKVKSKYSVCAKNSAFLLLAIAKISLILIRAPLIAFACATLMEVAIGAIGLIFVYKLSGLSITRWRTSIQRGKMLLIDSWPLLFSGVSVLINMQIDKIMLGEISGDRAVGIYSAATRISEIWYFIPIMVGLSVMQTLTKEREIGGKFYQIKLQKVYDIMTVFALWIAFPLSLFSDNIIRLIYGVEFLGAAQILQIHIWSALFVFHVSIRTRSLIIENLERFVAFYAFFTMSVNVLLNLVLIPNYAGAGAAYASLFSWLIAVLLLPLFSKKTSGSVLMFFRSFTLSSLWRIA
jgi:PST family polysaccharide transporter